jgi:hypothetical protein
LILGTVWLMRGAVRSLRSEVTNGPTNYRYEPVGPVEPGSTLYAYTNDGPRVPITTGLIAHWNLLQAVRAHDDQGQIDLSNAGQLFKVPIGTAVKILEYHDGLFHNVPAYEVRVLDGEFAGKKGWIVADGVRERVETRTVEAPTNVKQLGCFTMVLMLGVAGVLGSIFLPTFSKTGAEVELVGRKGKMIFLCSDEAIFMDRGSTSRQSVPGKDIFAVSVSERARVLEDKGDRLQVRVLEGSWKDRVGWIASDEVRLRPSPEEELRDVVEGITLDKRREIYAELFRVRMLAELEARHQVPLRDLPADPSECRKVLAENKVVYEALEREGQQSLIARYLTHNIDQAHLDRIDKEGTEERWPLPEVADPYKQ